jgi:hypothetical protein
MEITEDGLNQPKRPQSQTPLLALLLLAERRVWRKRIEDYHPLSPSPVPRALFDPFFA